MYDEESRWLSVRRGRIELACNFSRSAEHVPVAGSEVVLATHEADLDGGHVTLPALSGALVR